MTVGGDWISLQIVCLRPAYITDIIVAELLTDEKYDVKCISLRIYY